MFEHAAIVGVGQSGYTRRPEPGQTALHFMRDAVVAALQDAALCAKDIQGMAVASFSLPPGSGRGLARQLGASLPLVAHGTHRRVARAEPPPVARPERALRGRPGVRVRAHRASYSYDNQEGDGLQTGISTFAKELWQDAGVRPDDIALASIYDDYPTMVLAQANDLGLIPGNDLARFCRVTIGEKRFPVNTWGGMLSAGQPGGHAGGLNGISEAVLQLQHRASERQVKGARLAVTTGYGMTMYRYCGTAPAAGVGRAGRSPPRPIGAGRRAPPAFFRS